MVGCASEQFDGALVDVARRTGFPVVHVVNDWRLKRQRPNLLLAQVEVEVEAIFCGHVIETWTSRGVIIITSPSCADNGFHFEEARFALVAPDGVGNIEFAEKAEVWSVEDGGALAHVVGCHKLCAEGEDRRDLLGELNAVGGTHVLEEGRVGGWGDAAGNNASRPVVVKARTLNGFLSVGREHHCAHSHKCDKLFHNCLLFRWWFLFVQIVNAWGLR